jgi:hypothetical protein
MEQKACFLSSGRHAMAYRGAFAAHGAAGFYKLGFGY